MALPCTSTEQGRSARCLRVALCLASSARLRSWRVEGSALPAPRFTPGRLRCFRFLPAPARLGSLRAMQPSPMRATRPNVGLAALPPRVAQLRTIYHHMRKLWCETRRLKCLTRGLTLRCTGSATAGSARFRTPVSSNVRRQTTSDAYRLMLLRPTHRHGGW